MLPAADVSERVRQLKALSDPTALRVCSTLTTFLAPARLTDVADRTGLSLAEVAEPVQALLEACLVTVAPSLDEARYSLTAVALIRFGRLLTSASPPITEPTGAVDLPPAVESIATRLAYRFSSTFSPETVHRYIADSYQLLRERASVQQHLPSLTNRFATDRLEALATARGLRLSTTPEVLFVCLQNAGRSQLAAALLEDLAGERLHVRTAGSQPAEAIDPTVLAALAEIGVPIRPDAPKPLSDEVVAAADVVVTMGCGDACPVYPGRLYLDWPVEDPVGQPIEIVRQIRDEISHRVQALADQLLRT
jgi:protein-tyrosine-phosphatase